VKKKVVSVLIIGLLCSILFLSAQAKTLEKAEMNKIKNQKISDASLPTKTIEEKCGTMKILTEREKQNNPALEIRIESNPVYIYPRPTNPGGGVDNAQHLLPKLYNTSNFMIHWTNGTDGGNTTDAVPLENSNSNGIPNYIENLASVFENVWSFEIENQGFQMPPNDTPTRPNDADNANPDGRYDVFVYNLGLYYSGYADPEQEYQSSPLTSYSYIGMRNDRPLVEGMQVTAAHEFFHAIQFGYNRNEDSWWMETSATYMGNIAYPAETGDYQLLSYWFNTCDMYGIETFEYDPTDPVVLWHPYANFIFAKRLQEDFGNEIIKSIWEQMRTSDYALTAINNTLISRNSSLVSEFSRFIESNFFLEEMYQNGTAYRNALKYTTFYNGVYLKYQYNAASANNITEINYTNTDGTAWMDKWATNYITMKLDPAIPKYLISFDGLDNSTNYIVELATKNGTVINKTQFQLNGTKDGSLELAYGNFQNVTLIIANAGNTSTINPSWRVTITKIPEIPVPPPPVYDVAIIDMQSSTSVALAGEEINITVVIKNNGTATLEEVNASVYWDQFWIKNTTVTNLNLRPGNAITWTIQWTIPPKLEGHVRLWANATIPEPDLRPENNLLESETLYIISTENLTGGGGGRMPLCL